jgi:uncharacterized protein
MSNMEDHRTHLRSPIWLPILVALILGGAYIIGKKIETRSLEPTVISVSGEGHIFAVPDIASLHFGVQTGRQKTAESAMKLLAERMEAIMDAVQSAGVAEKDIKSQHLSLNPAYDWNEGRRIDRGFEANQSLLVKVRDLDSISDVLDAAVRAGANQAGSVNFTIDDPEDLKREARESAIADAKQKARVLAGQLGVTLGKMKGFSEGGDGGRPVYMERAMSMDAVGIGGVSAPPIPAGEQEIVVRVHLSYEVR